MRLQVGLSRPSGASGGRYGSTARPLPRPHAGVVQLFAPPAAGIEYARHHFAGVVAEAQAATANAVVSETTSHSRHRRRITVRWLGADSAWRPAETGCRPC
jgi:hypothetical protein